MKNNEIIIIEKNETKLKKLSKEVIALVQSRMCNNRYFRSKVSDTEFKFKLINDAPTNGLMRVNLELNSKKDNLKGFEISYDINPNDPVEWIRLIMAHELYHLFYAVNSVVKLDGYCPSDGSYSFTTIQRAVKKEGKTKIYGKQFEENLCWVLAYDTCKGVNAGKKRGVNMDIYDKHVYFIENYSAPIRAIIGAFTVIPCDLSSIEFDRSANLVPYNKFYCCMSCGDISYIVNSYDSVLGCNSWYNLMNYVDEYYLNQDETAKEKIYASLDAYKNNKGKRSQKVVSNQATVSA